MFDFVTKNKRIAQVILALIILPFAFFGVDYYFRGGTQAGDVATVAGEPISAIEFDNVVREQQDRLRSSLGANFDPAIVDSPEFRASVLDQLITRKLLQKRARDENFRVSDQQLERFIREFPAFQIDGRFSFEQYRQALQSQGMSQQMFEERVRQDLALQALQEPYNSGTIVSAGYVARVIELAEERREVSVATVDIEPFLAQVSVDEAQAKSFYEANQGAFQSPERVKAEYLVLSLDALAAATAVDAAEVKQQYEQNLKLYSQAEERQASHILVAAGKDAKPEEKAAAEKKAQEIADEVRKAPDRFAELARKHSDDPGSKDQGGDLGFFGRGNMVKPFEDAVFGMNVGDIAGPVETDFGFHVIRLTNVKGEGARPLAQVQAQIEQDLRRQKASRRFAELAESFQNLVYEQADTLAGVEKMLNEKGAGVKVERTDWVTREQALALAQNNAKFVQALFAPESIQGKRNTETIEIAPNTLMAGRVVEHQAAAPRPFEEVKADIIRQLQRKEASGLARKSGEEKLALLQKGADAGIVFGPSQPMARAPRPEGMSEETAQKIFRLDSSKLPAHLGAPSPSGGYSLYRVSKVIKPAAPDEDRLKAAAQQVEEQIAREQFSAFLGQLRAKAEVSVRQDTVVRK